MVLKTADFAKSDLKLEQNLSPKNWLKCIESIDIKIRDIDGKTQFHYACKNGQEDVDFWQIEPRIF